MWMGIRSDGAQRDHVIEPHPRHRLDPEPGPCLLEQHPAVRGEGGTPVLDLQLDAHHAERAAVRGELTLGVGGVQVPAEVVGDLLELAQLTCDVAAARDGHPRVRRTPSSAG